jgi:hypothetical protein
MADVMRIITGKWHGECGEKAYRRVIKATMTDALSIWRVFLLETEVYRCTVLAAGVTECLCLRAQESFARIGLRGTVEDIGGEGRALWRMIIYHILGIIVFPPLDQVLLASQPCIQNLLFLA